MSNHYHVVLRVDAEQSDALNRDQVIVRWKKLFGGDVLVDRYGRGRSWMPLK